jgi:soluble lytic murein transglycosylase-like protein
MKLPRNIPHLRSVKFAPFALISLFLFTNLTGVFFSRALAPVVNASPVVAALEMIPLDIPTSGNPDLDWIIFRTGEREGVDPRFIHAVIWQESK